MKTTIRRLETFHFQHLYRFHIEKTISDDGSDWKRLLSELDSSSPSPKHQKLITNIRSSSSSEESSDEEYPTESPIKSKKDPYWDKMVAAGFPLQTVTSTLGDKW